MVHLRIEGEVEPVFSHRSLLELLECLQHLHAVVKFRTELADLNAVTLYVEAVSDAGQIGLELLRFGEKRRKVAGLGVGRQIIAEGQEAARS